ARIERGAEAVHVTPRSMALLVYLAEAAGRVVSRNELLDTLWPRMAVTQDALSQCIVELRKAFRDDSKRAAVIETIPKVGIRLMASVAILAVRDGSEAPVVPQSEIPPSMPPRMVGRLAELAALETRLRQAIMGRLQIVFVIGEPGIGKTTLLDVFADRHAASGEFAYTM